LRAVFFIFGGQNKTKIFAYKKLKKTPSKVAQEYSIRDIYGD
jgi:hypothetical protein